MQLEQSWQQYAQREGHSQQDWAQPRAEEVAYAIWIVSKVEHDVCYRIVCPVIYHPRYYAACAHVHPSYE